MPKSLSIHLIIAVKSGAPEQLLSAYKFTQASLNNPKIIIDMLFFYQEAVWLLVNNKINNQISDHWRKLLIANNLTVTICKAAAKKRGITKINQPFTTGSMVEFISSIDNTDRVIQF